MCNCDEIALNGGMDVLLGVKVSSKPFICIVERRIWESNLVSDFMFTSMFFSSPGLRVTVPGSFYSEFRWGI